MAPDGKFMVLVVDDDELALRLAIRVLSDDEDVVLLTTTSANDALMTAMQDEIDLVISDQRMSEMNGLQLLARISELRPDAYRILLTGYPELDVALEGINQGLLDSLVLKPWAPQEMRATVRKALEERRERLRVQRENDELRTNFEARLSAEKLDLASQITLALSRELGPEMRSLATDLVMLQDGEDEIRSIVHALPRSTGGRSALEAHGRNRRIITSLRDTVARLQSMLDSFQLFSQVGSADEEPVDVAVLVEEAMQSIAARFPAGVQPTLQIERLPRYLARRVELIRLVYELLANAQDAVLRVEQPAIVVRGYLDAGLVVIEVQDSGPGIEERHRSSVFDPFFTTKTLQARAGLGLTIAKEIASGHGGSIRLESKPGATIFSVRLPLKAAAKVVGAMRVTR